jgi:hypothetical protein
MTWGFSEADLERLLASDLGAASQALLGWHRGRGAPAAPEPTNDAA